MNEEQKYTIQGLEVYILQGEPQQRERGEIRQLLWHDMFASDHSALMAAVRFNF